MKPTPQQIHAAATAIVNARGMRRGAPPIVNILDVLPPHLRSEALLDGEAAATTVLGMSLAVLPAALAEIAEAFSRTIFWNNLQPWPAEPLSAYPCRVIRVGEQAIEDALLVRAEFGELDVTVALLPAQGDDADAGNVTSESDAEFIANLPVYMPILLRAAGASRSAEARQPLFPEEVPDAS